MTVDGPLSTVKKQQEYRNMVVVVQFCRMKVRGVLTFCSLFLTVGFYSCQKQLPADPCCDFSDLPSNIEVNDGQGSLIVEGSTAAYFYVLDESGNQVGYQHLNQPLALDEGSYRVKVNNVEHRTEIRSGTLARCYTGTLMVTGNTSENYTVMDSAGRQLNYEALGKTLSFFPGSFKVKVNNTEASVDIQLKAMTELRTGTLVVRGTTGEYYYVLDDDNKQLNYNTLEKPLAFLPGTYLLKVNNTSMEADVFGGKVTELRTGNLLVKGLTEEYYYVTDTVGNALNYQTLNKPLAFFPGNVFLKVNNTSMKATVVENETRELVTGSLMLTGGGTQYYYVLDAGGTQLNYNSLNKSLSFFPDEYIVKLGASTRTATVTAGQLTSLNAFN
jgi:hypothetical protein